MINVPRELQRLLSENRLERQRCERMLEAAKPTRQIRVKLDGPASAWFEGKCIGEIIELDADIELDLG